MDSKATNVLAGLLLLFMLGLGFFSMKGDSTTMDELPHIPSGYSYITQRDMRLNPEHPPLLKDLAGLSVLVGSKITQTPINFPDEHKSWQEDLNGQWEFGRVLLYQSGNDADKIVFWGRLPMLLIMLVLGFFVFRWAREIYGNTGGLIALFLYSFSPTFIAHGRYVTTDVGAAAAFFIATYYLVKWLRESSRKNLILAGLVFGLALLTKFSLVIIIPFFVFLVVVWALLKKPKPFLNLGKYLIGLLLIGLIAMILIWPVYQYHIMDYPVERQLYDTTTILETYGNRLFAEPVIWMSDKPIFRPYGQFFLGVLMVVQRSVGGNTTYFLSQVSNLGWKEYFPIVFLIKVPLALLILSLVALFYSAYRVKEPFWKRTWKRFFGWIRNHFAEFALFIFFILYWVVTLRSNLNIGVRHILPTFPVIYILLSGQMAKLAKNQTWRLIILLLFIWYGFGALSIYPHFLAYFNESIGGPSQGHKYVVDSNLDWGQDLKRLNQFVQEKNIKAIYLDYFGGDSPEYRLGDKFQPWWGTRNPKDLPNNSWLAVSASFLQGGKGCPIPSLEGEFGFYRWLNNQEPVTTIGHSIFVYNIK